MPSLQAVVFVNGTITRAQDAVVPVFDHGFLYGEGVYETLRTYGGQPFLFHPHMERLRNSARLMRLDVPYDDAQMLQHIDATTAAYVRHFGPVGEIYIRILLTRGVGGLTYAPDACPAPTLVIIVKAFPFPASDSFSKGIRVSLVSVRRNHPDALNPAIKSNNLLNNALAMQEALRHGGDEALMQNQAGHVVECSQSNFFIVKDGQVATAPLAAGLLPGITRAFVIDLAREMDLIVSEVDYSPADVFAADEAFITGTTREVTPVIAVDEHLIGDGTPGQVTLRLLEAFRRSLPTADTRTSGSGRRTDY
ncbi:MAG: aminotransferase class IV [Acidobacteria bacterium]|jgi:branched-chain amino acid aminotransferase|nr:aminotransferase class IV [Acidobacteriota bacterium]